MSRSRPSLRWRSRAVDAFALLICGAVLVPMALNRYIDGDEGWYAYAAKNVTAGRVPYRDFAYLQMPLLPYVYGGWMRVIGESWDSARMLSALLGIALGVLVYAYSLRRFGRSAAFVAVFAYAASALVFGWLTTVKTYSLSGLIVFGAFIVIECAPTRRRMLIGGVVLGLGIGTRLILVGAVPAFLIYLLARRRLDQATSFLVGLSAGLLPSLVFFALAPDGFLFNNVEYQGVRSSHGLIGDFGQKARILANLVGYGATDREAGIQFLLLLLASVAGAVYAVRRERRVPLAALLALFLGAASLLPTPAYTQYYSIIVPFLIVTALELAPGVRGRILLTGIAAALLVYSIAGAVSYTRYFHNHRYAAANIGAVQRVASVVQGATRPGEAVMVSWPGYLLGTHAVAFPGFENPFTPEAAVTLSPSRAARLHYLTPSQIERLIELRRTRVAVFRTWATVDPKPDWSRALSQGGYRQIARVLDAGVYRRSDPASRPTLRRGSAGASVRRAPRSRRQARAQAHGAP
jgi:4-amino-4-deoxy-L-arabinose transferase-like glycosyltransferase